MEQLDNDMNELFQRAAEQYQLDAGKSDWDNIASRLREPGNSAAVVVDGKRFSNSSFRFLAAAMLLGLVGMLYPKFCVDPILSSSVVVAAAEKSTITATLGNNDKNNVSSPQLLSPPVEISSMMVSGNKNNRLSGGTNQRLKGVNKTSLHSINAGADNLSAKYKQLQKERAQQSLNITNGNINVIGDDKIAETDISINDKTTAIPPVAAVTPLNEPVEKVKTTTFTKTKSIEERKKTTGWYAGIFTITDASKVKSMPFNDIGFGGGILLGYNINNKLSVEGSVALQQKKYGTYGKDFSMDKIGSSMPTGMVVNQLKSTTAVAELSVNLRYKIVQQKKSTVYAAAGLSAYNVTKERNNYNVTLNGNAQTMKALYKENSAKLPAVAGFAAGYEYNVNSKTAVRIEPYLKIPIQGIGVGSVPVTSTGLHLGITRSLR